MKIKNYLLFFLITTIAFWQIFFLQNSMKWDFIDAFLPSRYFFTEAILNNEFPFWNPYILYGIPIYADLSSVFNPEFWIIGNLFGYSNITLQLIYLVYISIAGIGFYHFLKPFETETKLALSLSIAYMLSGLSIGNAQNLAIVSGYAILPFVLTQYQKLLSRLSISHFIGFSIGLFFMIYGSYPALSIILAYLLFSLFIYSIFSHREDSSYLKKLFVFHILIIITLILFSSVLIFSYFQAQPFLSQYSGIGLEKALDNPFTLKSLLSIIFPMASGKDAQFFETDYSMSNGYFGIISLLLLFFSWTKKSSHKVSYIFLFFGVFSLLSSFGEAFFLREFLYRHFPLMDLFRYPSIFRAFTIFGFLAYIGINHQNIELFGKDKTRFYLISSFLIITILGTVIYAQNKITHFIFFDNSLSFIEKIINASLYDSIIFQGWIQILILSIFILIVYKAKTRTQFFSLILMLFIADGLISTQLSIYNSVINKKDPIAFYNYLKSTPKGFPIPELTPIRENSDKNAQNEFVWMNENIFPKKVSFDGLISFKLDGYTKLADHYPQLLEKVKNQAIVYFSDNIRKNNKIDNLKNKATFLNPKDYKNIKSKTLGSNKNDVLNIRNFSNNKIEIQTKTQQSQLLIYQQNFYYGWEVFIDGEKQKLLNVNFAHMAVLLPSGKHTVLFKYSNNIIKWSFYFSYSILFLLITLSLFFYIKKHPEQKHRILLIVGLILSILVLGSLVHRFIYQKNKEGLSSNIVKKMMLWKTTYPNMNSFLSSPEYNFVQKTKADKSAFLNDKSKLPILSHFLMKSKSNYFAFAWQGAQIDPKVLPLLYSFYPEIIEKKQNFNSGIMLLKKNPSKNIYNSVLDFETHSTSEWNYNPQEIKFDSLSNNHYLKYDSCEFGAALTITVDSSLIKLKKIVILSDIYFEQSITKLPLVFTVEKNDNKNIWESIDLSLFTLKPEQWYKTVYQIDTEEKLSKGDKIKIYFWNKNQAIFNCDNLKVKYIY